MKRCSYCQITKSLTLFHRNQRECIDCRKIRAISRSAEKVAYDRDRFSRLRNSQRLDPRARAGMLAANAKSRALAGDMRYDLTPEIVHVWMIEQNFCCSQTGIEFDFTQSGSQRSLRGPSLDRKDVRFGYTLANTQLVCLFYNIAKNNSTDEDIWSLMRQAVTYRGDR